eukprot:s1_g2104.t1
MAGRAANAVKKGLTSKSAAQQDEVAAYAFDMLQSLRETCSDENHRFLSYLIGMAAEEAQRLSEGLPSASRHTEKPAAGPRRANNH